MILNPVSSLAGGSPMKRRLLSSLLVFLFMTVFAVCQDVASFEKRITVKKLERTDDPHLRAAGSAGIFILHARGCRLRAGPNGRNRPGAHVRAYGVQGYGYDRHN